MYTLWLGPQILQKPKCKKSGIKGVHNLKIRHWVL